VFRPRQQGKLARGAKDEEHAMAHKLNSGIAVIGIDIGKNSFHVVGHDKRGAILLRQPGCCARAASGHAVAAPPS
jgi:transposase